MAGFSDYLKNEVLDHVFGKGAYTPPTIYVALSTTEPADDGTNVTEPDSGDAYVRVETAASDWSAAGGSYDDGVLKNSEPIEFAEATGAWRTIAYFALYDSEDDLGSNNMLGWGAVTTPKTVGSGDTARFAAEGLEVTIS